RTGFAISQHLRGVIQHSLLLHRALQLPVTQIDEQYNDRQCQQPPHHQCVASAHVLSTTTCDNPSSPAVAPGWAQARRSKLMKTLLIIGFLVLILWNLGAALYYMLVDKGESKRTVNALTRRVALSIAMIVFVVIAAKMG